jgi:hypothetical protein
VAFLEPSSGLAFPGDVAGVRLASGVVMAPTPPPDIDLDSWRESLALIASWGPRALALPHFGLVEEPERHVAELREALDRHERWAGEGEDVFVARLMEHLRARMPESEAEDYAFIALARASAVGLRRWLEKQGS